MKEADQGETRPSPRSRKRLGGLLVSIGLILYGGMLLAFGITDEDVTELVGGFGIVLAGIGVYIATREM